MVNDRPVYSPIDPRLTTINPEAIADGMLKSFEVATAGEKLQAFKAQNEEIANLRADREAQAHATLQNQTGSALAAMQLRPQQTANQAYGDKTIGMMQPLDRDLQFNQKLFDVGQQGLLQNTQAQVNQATNQSQGSRSEAMLNDAATAAARSGGALHRVDQENLIASDTADLNASDVAFKLQQQADTQKLAAAALADQLANAKTDKDRARLQSQYALELTKSQIAENNAKAAKDNAYAVNGPRAEDLTKEVNGLLINESKILDQPLPSGVKVKEYIRRLQEDPLMTPDPAGQQAIEQLRGLRVLRADSLKKASDLNTKKNVDAQAAAAGPPVTVHFNPVTPVAPAAPVPPAVRSEAYNWAVSHPDDPRSAAILQRLGVK